MRGEITKQKIIERGLSLASIVGLGGITIGQLAKEVGMSKSGLYRHFKSKENLQLELFKAAVSMFVEKVISPAFKEPRGESRILALFELWMKWTKSKILPGGCIFIDATVEFDDQPGPLRDYVVQSQRDWLETISNSARIAIQEGHFRKDLDTMQFAYEIYSTTSGYHFIERLLEDPLASQRARRSIEKILEDARTKKE